MTLGLALFALGFLIAAQLRTEAPRVRYTTQERSPLVETTLGLQSQQEQLKSRVLALRAGIQDLQQKSKGSATSVRELNDSLAEARLEGGLVTLQGSGVVIQLQDSTDQVQVGDNATDYLVNAADIRAVVEELWLAGAEAMAINGERVTAGTAILDIGGSVLVNSAYLAPPYQVSAIGAAGLYDRLNGSMGFQDFVRARAEAFGIRVSHVELKDVVVPAYAGILNLRYAQPNQDEPSATPARSADPAGAAGQGAGVGSGGTTGSGSTPVASAPPVSPVRTKAP